MNWKILRSPIIATLTNPNFLSFCELGKSLKYCLRPTFKSSNFESKDKLSSTVENKGNLHKIRQLTCQTYIMNEILTLVEFEVFSNGNKFGKTNFSLGKWNFEPIGNSVHIT